MKKILILTRNQMRSLSSNRNKKGMVMMIVLSTVALLLIIVQEMAFNSQVELRNGAAHYHRLRAYHAAKSGLQMALLKILIYKKAQKLLNTNPSYQSFIKQAQPYLNLLWLQPENFPPALFEDLPDIKKNRIKEKINLSLMKNVSYSTQIENEGSKLDLNGMISPNPFIRKWTQQTLYYLLINLRNKHSWLSSKYSKNDMQKITEDILNSLSPTHPSSLVNKHLYPALLDLNDLKAIDSVNSEIIEFIRPYVTLYGDYGFNPAFAHPFLLKSLGENVTDDMVNKLLKRMPEEHIDQIDTYKSLFNEVGMSYVNDYYFSPGAGRPLMAHLIFNTDAPQNFKIISKGVSNTFIKSIEAIVYDPEQTLLRAFRIFEKQKKEGDNFPPSKINLGSSSTDMDFKITPFIIYWKDIN